jgi:hypothetical protein
MERAVLQLSERQGLLPFETVHGALHVLVELAQSAPVRGHGEPVGVRDPFTRNAGCVL